MPLTTENTDETMPSRLDTLSLLARPRPRQSWCILSLLAFDRPYLRLVRPEYFLEQTSVNSMQLEQIVRLEPRLSSEGVIWINVMSFTSPMMASLRTRVTVVCVCASNVS